MLIGILQTGQSPEALRDDMGDYPDFFRELLANKGLQFRTYHVENMQFPVSVHDCDGWLITGSRHGAYEDHPFVKPLETFIRKAMSEQVRLSLPPMVWSDDDLLLIECELHHIDRRGWLRSPDTRILRFV